MAKIPASELLSKIIKHSAIVTWLGTNLYVRQVHTQLTDVNCAV